MLQSIFTSRALDTFLKMFQDSPLNFPKHISSYQGSCLRFKEMMSKVIKTALTGSQDRSASSAEQVERTVDSISIGALFPS